MLNIDPLLFQPKVIRMSTTSSIGLPGQHIIRTTEYSNSQVMTGTQARNEANNNVITSNDMELEEEYDSRTGEYTGTPGMRSYSNSNETGAVGHSMSHDSDDKDTSSSRQLDWISEQMYWSGDGDSSGSSTLDRIIHQNSASIMSFQSNLSNSSATTSVHSQLSDHTESKEELINSLLNKVRSHNKVEASKILLAMSNSVENCIAMRQSGCLPLLVQLLHSPEENANTYHIHHAKRVNFEVRERVSQVLHNVVFSQPDDKKGRREARVLRLLEQIREYCDQLRSLDVEIDDNKNDRCVDQHLGPSVAALMKLSFDEEHRYAMCQLGGLQAIAELLQIDHEVHGCTNDQYCITIRRYAGMALTNLTFGDGANKALLCSLRPFMEALVAQLYSPSEDLRQVTASVLRNLSWRADSASKRMLRDVGAVTTLMKAAMEAEKESTLKSILSALWNLSAHCSSNKADICLVDGALAFLVSTLTYNSKSKTLAIVENGGGILRNVSSHIAIQNDYRVILRKHNCLQILLQHLKSPSLTVVSNACGTLWNLSARNAGDQRALWEMGAVGMLKKLINSKHKMISMGSSAALKNLLSAKPPGVNFGMCVNSDTYKYNTDMPSLHVRKQKALSTEIDQNLSETYDNTDSPKTSPINHGVNDKGNRSRRHISPSAYGMTAQRMNRQRNDLLAVQGRKSVEEKPNCTYVVEEKHNGAFQVTKNAKQSLNYRQGQHRFPNETKENVVERNAPVSLDCESKLNVNSPSNLRITQKPGKSDRPYPNAEEPCSPKYSKVVNGERIASANMSPLLAVKKEHLVSERQTNSAQRTRTTAKEECPVMEQTAKHFTEASSQSPTPKPFHESKIPLPRSMNKGTDSQRSLSASPVAHRRSTSQRQEPAPNINRTMDHTTTHPKYAWNASYEKEDNEPEEPVNFSKRHSRYDYAKERNDSPQHLKECKPYSPLVTKVLTQDFSYGSDDEIKVYETENTPLNSSLMSSANDLDETGASTRCSLNIKTSTNVKLMKNHPLLSNTHRDEDDDVKLFEVRQPMKERICNEKEGKTVVFDIEGDFEIEETLSMLSRSSSVASISSFDQQSIRDDDSFASDLSHRTSGIESPSELSNSPCQTVPSSPHNSQSHVRRVPSSGSDISDAQLGLTAADVGADEDYHGDVIGEEMELPVAVSPGDVTDPFDEDRLRRFPVDDVAACSPLQGVSSSAVPQINQISHKDIVCMDEEAEVTALAAKLVSDRKHLSPTSTTHQFQTGSDSAAPTLSHMNKPQNETQIVRSSTVQLEKPDHTDVQRASRSSSLSSLSLESLEEISPTERALLEECVRAGLPKRNLHDKTNGARQKTTQLSYQVLRDTIERHPNHARCYESDRGMSLRNLEVKDYDYESLSENEEKGKEDERKAEKNRLFRIPESPVDKKMCAGGLSVDSNKKDYSSVSLEEHPSANTEQKSGRSFGQVSERVHGISTESVPSQLDFLMSSKKCHASAQIPSRQVNYVSDRDSENVDESAQGKKSSSKVELSTKANLQGNQSGDQRAELESSLCREEHKQETTEVPQIVTELNDLVEGGNVNTTEFTINDQETLEKDIDCCEKENSGDSEESMLTSSILCEAKEIADALLGARVDSTEDMTVSTLSCLSDIDNARPPSVMGDLGSLSMTNSGFSDEGLKAAVSKECQKLFGKHYNKQSSSSSKKSLLRELQIVRLNSDHGSNDNSKGSNGSPENQSMKSSTSDLLGNMNPPSIMDDMSLTASTESIGEVNDLELESEQKVVIPYTSNQDSMSERMNDAAAMAQLYAKELSNITGNCMKYSNSNEALSRMKFPSAFQEVMEVTIADVTEIGCDTIGSDTELDDDFPCDDEDPGSDTLQAPYPSSLSKDEPGEGSTENLTLTLTEEPPRGRDFSPYQGFEKHNGYHMTADEFKALQENADLIVNTLKTVQISECGDVGGLSSGDMLEDETMSLVSNESDEEYLSPDGTVHPGYPQKCSPRSDFQMSPVYNGMIALPQNDANHPKSLGKKNSSLPQFSVRKKSYPSGLPSKSSLQSSKTRYSYPETESSNLNDGHRNIALPQNLNSADITKPDQMNITESPVSKLKVPSLARKHAPSNAANLRIEDQGENAEDLTAHAPETGNFDSRTFTKKKTTIPRNRIPSVQSTIVPPSSFNSVSQTIQSDLVRSPSANSSLSSLSSNSEVTTSSNKTVTSKISAVWKNSGKPRSKSAVDPNRSGKLRLEKTASTGSNSSISYKDEEKGAVSKLQRPSTQPASPKKSLSRSSTYERLDDNDDGSKPQSIKRPSTLAIVPKPSSPRTNRGITAPQRNYANAPPKYSTEKKPEGLVKPRTISQKPEELRYQKTQQYEVIVLSPTSIQNGIPKFQNKAQGSLIPSRRSMIPTPAKFGGLEN